MPKKANEGIRVSYDLDGMRTKYHIVDKDGKELTVSDWFDFADYPKEIQDQITLYGQNKILTDRTSDQKDKFAKLKEMAEVHEMFADGIWRKERVAGAPTVSIEVEALARYKRVTIPQIQKALRDPKYKDKRDQILADPKLEPIKEAIRKEREAEAEIDLEDLG